MITTRRGSRPSAARANRGMNAQAKSAPPAMSMARRDGWGLSQSGVIALSPLEFRRHEQEREALLLGLRAGDRLTRLGRCRRANDCVEHVARVVDVLDLARGLPGDIEANLHGLRRGLRCGDIRKA